MKLSVTICCGLSEPEKYGKCHIEFIICHAIWITCSMVKETVQKKKKKMMRMHLLKSTDVIEMDLSILSVILISL